MNRNIRRYRANAAIFYEKKNYLVWAANTPLIEQKVFQMANERRMFEKSNILFAMTKSLI
jgi:hypothetical protein